MAYADGPWEVTGVSGITTGFPVPVAETASWDTTQSYLKGQAMGDEAFQEDRNGLLAPGINLARTPYGGRNAEFMGEDPLLAGTMAAQDIIGMQRGNPAEPVEAVVKHFVANDQELDRQLSSSNVDARTLREQDGLAFEIATRQARPAGVMCSYNQVNSVYACENPNTLTDYLKRQLGFRGFVVSDFGAVHSTVPSLNAGLDQELNRPNFYSPANLEAALAAGTITEAQVDAITSRAQQDGDTVTFDDGASRTSAAATASAADVSIVFGYYTEGEGSDRANINLDSGGDALISAVAAANPHTIVVLETGSAVLMPWLSQVKSVLEAWYPGVQQGPALAALLFGDADPSGHLPVTFPRSPADLPTAGSAAQYPGVFADGSTTRAPGDRTSIRQVDYTEGLETGHAWYDAQGVTPLFPASRAASRSSSTRPPPPIRCPATTQARSAGSRHPARSRSPSARRSTTSTRPTRSPSIPQVPLPTASSARAGRGRPWRGPARHGWPVSASSGRLPGWLRRRLGVLPLGEQASEEHDDHADAHAAQRPQHPVASVP